MEATQKVYNPKASTTNIPLRPTKKRKEWIEESSDHPNPQQIVLSEPGHEQVEQSNQLKHTFENSHTQCNSQENDQGQSSA